MTATSSPAEPSESTLAAADGISERDMTMRCTMQLFGRCDGWMQPWRGSDGHSGSETFYTCDRCGRTT